MPVLTERVCRTIRSISPASAWRRRARGRVGRRRFDRSRLPASRGLVPAGDSSSRAWRTSTTCCGAQHRTPTSGSAGSWPAARPAVRGRPRRRAGGGQAAGHVGRGRRAAAPVRVPRGGARADGRQSRGGRPHPGRPGGDAAAEPAARRRDARPWRHAGAPRDDRPAADRLHARGAGRVARRGGHSVSRGRDRTATVGFSATGCGTRCSRRWQRSCRRRRMRIARAAEITRADAEYLDELAARELARIAGTPGDGLCASTPRRWRPCRPRSAGEWRGWRWEPSRAAGSSGSSRPRRCSTWRAGRSAGPFGSPAGA